MQRQVTPRRDFSATSPVDADTAEMPPGWMGLRPSKTTQPRSTGRSSIAPPMNTIPTIKKSIAKLTQELALIVLSLHIPGVKRLWMLHCNLRNPPKRGMNAEERVDFHMASNLIHFILFGSKTSARVAATILGGLFLEHGGLDRIRDVSGFSLPLQI